MTLEVVSATHSTRPSVEDTGPRGELVRRVAASATFEKSPRLRAFFIHVCRCALQNKPEEATEQQIGIYVYGKAPGYNPNDDNIVRSQARVLRMKLEHHFANEGQHESLIITIPKGQYLPVFRDRAADKPPISEPPAPQARKIYGLRWLLLIPAVLVLLWIANLLLKPGLANLPPALVSTVTSSPETQSPRDIEVGTRTTAAPAGDDIRISAGRTGATYADVWGHQWGTDRDFEGGVARPGPKRFFPPVPDKGLFATIRQAISADPALPEWQREFQYHIPLNPGVYELRLYFADPLRLPEEDQKEDSQNVRHIVVEANGNPLLVDLDPIADAGQAAVDVRVFKDVSPSDDGKLHLEFRSRWGQPAFVSGIELRPGTPGILRPIRISTHVSDFTDTDGTRWSGDNYFIDGRTSTTPVPRNGPKIPLLYNTERHGNFSYSIPVVPGTYTVRLHFMETFFSSLIPAAFCHGAGCRVFDVSCNGVSLLQDFDVYQAAGGAFRPVIREFRGLHPNGQGKLLLSFSPKVNYAEVRAIEVLEEPN